MEKFRQFTEAKDLGDHAKIISEVTSQHSRYSIEVNYRTEINEAMDDLRQAKGIRTVLQVV